MRAAQRAFWERRKDDATKSVGEHMSASQTFSLLKFYQHVFSFLQNYHIHLPLCGRE